MQSPTGPACRSNWIANSSEDPVDKSISYTFPSQSFHLLCIWWIYRHISLEADFRPTSGRAWSGPEVGLKCDFRFSDSLRMPVDNPRYLRETYRPVRHPRLLYHRHIMIRCCFGDIFKKGKNPKFLILENIFPLRVAILEKIKNDDSWSAMPCEPNNHVLHPITRPHQSRDFPGRRFSSLKLCWKNASTWGPLEAHFRPGLKWASSGFDIFWYELSTLVMVSDPQFQPVTTMTNYLSVAVLDPSQKIVLGRI